MHSLLKRQLNRIIGDIESLTPQWSAFLKIVDQAYEDSDADRLIIERSLELTSKELIERNTRLRDELSERQKAEEQLRLWAKVYESSREGIFITDSNKTIISVNRAFTDISGFPQEEVIGRYPYLFEPDPDEQQFLDSIWQAVDNAGHWQGEMHGRHENGEPYPVRVEITAARNLQGDVVNYIVIFSDISAWKESEERIRYLAHHDYLTGLPNRSLLRDRLELAMTHARRLKSGVAILFIDLDRFKTINDSLGHHVGDLLLQQVAGRLKACVRQEDTVSRLGGDEFVIILGDIDNAYAAGKVAAKVENAVRQPYHINETEFHITISTGISIFPDDGEDIDTLLMNADAAMYHAKDNERNNYQFFTSKLNAKAKEKLTIETNLRRALERSELILHYQPQLDLITGRITGLEALVRWRRPEEGLISPAKFIPLAEETGLIIPIGEWVLQTAAAQMKEWQAKGLCDLVMAVNVSPRQFKEKNFPGMVETVLIQTGLEPCFLELELTEGLLMQDPKGAAAVLNRLKELGIQVSLDDFGTGYSSLSYLKRFPIDCLKIDKTFVHEITTDASNAVIVNAVISLAHNMNMRVIAEGVESQEQLAYLRAHHCDKIQGYYFCPPLSSKEITSFLLKRSKEIGKLKKTRNTTRIHFSPYEGTRKGKTCSRIFSTRAE